MDEKRKAKIMMSYQKNKKWYEDYYMTDEFLRRDTFGKHVPFESLLSNALNKPIGTPYDFTDGFLEGEKRGFSEGAEKSIKSFVTSGQPKIFVSGDKIIPYSKNNDLLQNPEIKPIIKEFSKTLPEEKKDIEKTLELILAESDLNNFKPFAEEEYNKFKTNFPHFNQNESFEMQFQNMINEKEMDFLKGLKDFAPLPAQEIKKLNPETGIIKKSMKKQPKFITEYIIPDYTLPLSNNQLKHIKNKTNQYQKKLNSNSTTNQSFYRQKLQGLDDLDNSMKKIASLKESYSEHKNNLELENLYSQKIKDNLETERKKYENMQKSSWSEKFLKEKNGKNAIFATPTFTTYNLKNIQNMFPTPNNMTVHEKIDLVNKTELTEDNMKLIKDYTGKNTGSKNIYDYITVPNQNIKHPLEDLIKQRYPNLNAMEKQAMDNYIKDKKKYI